MKGKSTINKIQNKTQIHIVKQVVEKSHEFNKDIHLLFINFKVTYDSIN
jgi:hypothetical protein